MLLSLAAVEVGGADGAGGEGGGRGGGAGLCLRARSSSRRAWRSSHLSFLCMCLSKWVVPRM